MTKYLRFLMRVCALLVLVAGGNPTIVNFLLLPPEAMAAVLLSGSEGWFVAREAYKAFFG